MSLGFPVTRRSSIILGRDNIKIEGLRSDLWRFDIYTHNGKAWELVYKGQATYDRYSSALLVATSKLHTLRQRRASV